jgi:hypothetical protein
LAYIDPGASVVAAKPAHGPEQDGHFAKLLFEIQCEGLYISLELDFPEGDSRGSSGHA